MAKRRGRPPALESASIAVLEGALASRRRDVARVEARRDRLAAQLAEVEKNLRAVEGTRGPGRARGGTRASAPQVAARRGRRGKTSLAEAITQVLKAAGEPMRVVAIAEAVRAAGYKSKAKRFDKMVHKALNQMGIVKRRGRGLYELTG